MTIYLFSQLILNWYHTHGRKYLPWQKNKTLYTVWISEVMLQQTTVNSVIPYFTKFILTYPDIKSIYNSELDKILYLWSGLGYYNRARNIYKSAQIITIKHHGIFPDTFLDIIKLPGIGRSTAGAILSLSLNFFYPILDANAKRILIRYYGIIGSLQDKAIEKKLWNIMESIIPLYNTGQFNQAIMDIGSSICTAIKPKCNICPLNKRCIANIQQKCENYPIKKITKTRPKKISWFIIIKKNHTFWMEKSTKEKIWNNLFCFPRFNTEELAWNWLKKNKIHKNQYIKITPFIHYFSHFILRINPILIHLSSDYKFDKQNDIGLWYNLQKPQHIGLPRPVQKILDNFKEDTF